MKDLHVIRQGKLSELINSWWLWYLPIPIASAPRMPHDSGRQLPIQRAPRILWFLRTEQAFSHEILRSFPKALPLFRILSQKTTEQFVSWNHETNSGGNYMQQPTGLFLILCSLEGDCNFNHIPNARTDLKSTDVKCVACILNALHHLENYLENYRRNVWGKQAWRGTGFNFHFFWIRLHSNISSVQISLQRGK